ncbi:hypothetical protein [Alkalihalobacillus sp. AL-G]|uniref:hypothetical protein n=1 Tax=Alkalihalobacillus sp. AL-G TaxID=2926399 RepID=UPI00272CF8EC|nr:hypothetical protein [Alkalihalobacillus sp. AL-G]WLD94565.1 hypothetical protein MOJ78_06690 [Alkalihalobacillus sp. AL-G]
MKKLKKKYIISGFFVLLILLCIATNPTKQEYVLFSKGRIGEAPPSDIQIEVKNFYVFSTFAPKLPMDHYGIVHLGFMGKFFRISDGQYDYPVWLEFSN